MGEVKRVKIINVKLFLDECDNKPPEGFVNGCIVNAMEIGDELYHVVDDQHDVVLDPDGESILFTGNEIDMELCEWVEEEPTPKFTLDHIGTLDLSENEVLVLSTGDMDCARQTLEQIPERLKGHVVIVNKNFDATLAQGVVLKITKAQYERYRLEYNDVMDFTRGGIHNPNYEAEYAQFVQERLGFEFMLVEEEDDS